MTISPHLQYDLTLANVDPFAVLRESPGLVAIEIETMWDRIEAKIGAKAFEQWVKEHHPTLLQMDVYKAWWLLSDYSASLEIVRPWLVQP